MERRHFLATSLMAAAAFSDPTALVGTAATATTATTAPIRGAAGHAFSEARFRGLVGSRFYFTGDAWRGHLSLADVVGRSSDARTEQFTTVFRTEGRVSPAPGVYEVDHPDAGRFTLRIDGQPESDVRLAVFALLRG